MNDYYTTLNCVNGKLRIFYTNKLSKITTTIEIGQIKKGISEINTYQFLN